MNRLVLTCFDGKKMLSQSRVDGRLLICSTFIIMFFIPGVLVTGMFFSEALQIIIQIQIKNLNICYRKLMLNCWK